MAAASAYQATGLIPTFTISHLFISHLTRMFNNIPLLPVLLAVTLLALLGPTVDYYRHGGATWWSYLTVAPLALLLLYLLLSAVLGSLRDLKGPRG